MLRKLMFVAPLFVLLSVGAVGQVPNCSMYNRNVGPIITSTVGTEDHIDGGHVYSNSMTGQDFYSGSGFGILCQTTCQATSGTAASEGGIYATAGIKHVDATADENGIATGPGQQAATAKGGAIVDQCPLVGGCVLTVGLDPVLHWSGPHTIRTYATNYTNTCPKHVTPTKPVACPDPGGTVCPAGERWVPQLCACNVSPLVIDTKGKFSQEFMRTSKIPSWGFSDPKKQYVTFDMKGNGHYEKVSFPLPGSGLMLLVDVRLEHGETGDELHAYVVDSGKFLFGSFSPHADWNGNKDQPGMTALSWHDQPKAGGNVDGIIDKKDKVLHFLRAWEPRHCFENMNEPCTARPEELKPLEAYGIQNISLFYVSSAEVDETSGVEIGSYALLNVVDGQPQTSHDNRLIFDAWLHKGSD